MTDVSGQYRITSDTDSQLLLFQKKLNNERSLNFVLREHREERHG